MRHFLCRLVDSRDRSVEAHAVLLIGGAAVFVALAVYHVVVLRGGFDPTAYGQGFACLMAGGGAAAFGQGMQRKVENPDPKQDE